MSKKERENEKISKEAIAPNFSQIEDLSKVDVNSLSAEEKELYNKELEKRQQEKIKLDEVQQAVSKKSQKKKKIMSLIFFFINLGVVAGLLSYQLIKEPFVSLEGLDVNGAMFVLLIFLFGFAGFIDVYSMGYLVKKDTGRYQMGMSFKAVFLGKYYDSITPLSLGGEPSQVAYLKSRDVSISASLSIPVAKMVFYQLAFFVVSIMSLIVSSIDASFGSFASITSIIGFVVSFTYLFVLIFLSISKKIGKKIVVKVLKFLQKIRIIKNYEKQYQSVTKVVEDFQTILKDYMKNPKDFIVMFFSSLLRVLVVYSMPYAIYSCFFVDGNFDLYFKFFVCGVLIDLASSFFPLPGGTGMNELTFGALFGSFFSGGRLFWAIIFWRLVTYYLYIIIGFVVLSYDISYGNRKFKWSKKERELQAESLDFKQVQIQKFRKERSLRRKRALKNR